MRTSLERELRRNDPHWLIASMCGLYRLSFDPALIDQNLLPFAAPATFHEAARALLKRPRILIFDEAVSNLDQQPAEHSAKTINTLKRQVTMLFITHQVSRELLVDEVFSFGKNSQHNTKVGVVGEE